MILTVSLHFVISIVVERYVFIYLGVATQIGIRVHKKLANDVARCFSDPVLPNIWLEWKDQKELTVAGG